MPAPVYNKKYFHSRRSRYPPLHCFAGLQPNGAVGVGTKFIRGGFQEFTIAIGQQQVEPHGVNIGSLLPGNFDHHATKGPTASLFLRQVPHACFLPPPKLQFPCEVCDVRVDIGSIGLSYDISMNRFFVLGFRTLSSPADLREKYRRVRIGPHAWMTTTRFTLYEHCYKAYALYNGPQHVPEFVLTEFSPEPSANDPKLLRVTWPAGAPRRALTSGRARVGATRPPEACAYARFGNQHLDKFLDSCPAPQSLEIKENAGNYSARCVVMPRPECLISQMKHAVQQTLAPAASAASTASTSAASVSTTEPYPPTW